MIIRFYLRDSFSFQVLHTTLGISFADVFKHRGKGRIDEVRVRSDIDVQSWTPEPTSQSHNEFVWINPSMEAAPDYYWLEIEPICIILVVIECLPSNHMVNVFVNGKPAGAIYGGDWHVFASPSELVFIEIELKEFSEGLITYRATSRVYLGSCPAVAMFRFQADYTNLIVTLILTVCIVTMVASWTGYSKLKRKKRIREEIALAEEREKVKYELARLEEMIKEYRAIIAKNLTND